MTLQLSVDTFLPLWYAEFANMLVKDSYLNKEVDCHVTVGYPEKHHPSESDPKRTIVGIVSEPLDYLDPFRSPYRDTYQYTGNMRIEILSAFGKTESYTREISEYIRDVYANLKIVHEGEWRLFTTNVNVEVSAEEAGHWLGKVVVGIIVFFDNP